MSPIVPPQLIVLRYCDTAKQEIIQRIVIFFYGDRNSMCDFWLVLRVPFGKENVA